MTPIEAMKLAITEAYKGAAFVSPNPLVGCVVLAANGEFISSGYHKIFGGPHAEVNALLNIPVEKLKDATVFVTLEPCAHEGKTGSCAKMLAKLPLKKVIYGLTDPNPLVAGQGAQILEAAGIATEIFSETHPHLKEDLEEVCEAFLWNYRQQKVFVSLKLAQSLDGQVALKNGESQWITNETSREHVHWLRASHDAVLVGRGTVQHDNPSLNIRLTAFKKDNKVVVIDPKGTLLDEASQLQITRAHDTKNLFWCVSEKSYSEKWPNFAKVLKVRETKEGPLDLVHLLQTLWDEGLRSVMIEGGALTASEFLKAGLVNRLLLFQAPIILGSLGGRSWTEGLEIPQMQHKLKLRNPKYKEFDSDLFITGRLS
jgi:diaminohydroxyphosphoribosylaminopyrimidine deaminase/5-amino-6-(5-phosphoribosylamino)uracil reductase